jgi:hypothetical protein
MRETGLCAVRSLLLHAGLGTASQAWKLEETFGVQGLCHLDRLRSYSVTLTGVTSIDWW